MADQGDDQLADALSRMAGGEDDGNGGDGHDEGEGDAETDAGGVHYDDAGDDTLHDAAGVQSGASAVQSGASGDRGEAVARADVNSEAPAEQPEALVRRRPTKPVLAGRVAPDAARPPARPPTPQVAGPGDRAAAPAGASAASAASTASSKSSKSRDSAASGASAPSRPAAPGRPSGPGSASRSVGPHSAPAGAAKPAARRKPPAKAGLFGSLGFRQTIIPICLTTGLLLIASVVLFYLQDPTAVLRQLSPAFPVLALVFGLILLGVGALNMILVQRQLAPKTP